MSKVNIAGIREYVYKLNNYQLNEELAVNIFGMQKTDEERDVLDIANGSVMGKSKWIASDGSPLMLPNFSETMFVGVLLIEDLNSDVDIRRKKGGKYEVKFLDGSGIKIKGESFPQTIARGALFEKYYKDAKGAK